MFRFRTATENASVAARLPLDEEEDDDVDSVVSESTVNSDTREQVGLVSEYTRTGRIKNHDTSPW